MNLYLQRHCKPTPGHPMDGSRSLTPEGVKQAQGMAAWMVKHIGRVDYVVTSPFNRAMASKLPPLVASISVR